VTSAPEAGPWPRKPATEKEPLVTWPRVAAVGAQRVLAFVVARGCQDSQIKVTQEEAIATAKEQVDFVPRDTQIRLLRQGIDRRPVWIVSLSIPIDADRGLFSRLALVRIDATSGEIDSVEEQETDRKAGQEQAGKSKQP
jgi:hypothetical protein